MNDPTLERDPIETLASEFTDRLRAGEQPTLQEYVDENPHVADEIRDLFPTIEAMEKLKSQKESRSGGRASLGPTRLEQLGDFRIVREIGRGGMGIVYEAEQLSLGRRVAVKVLPKQSLLDEKHLMRFRREAKTAGRLHHTNIVPVLGVGEHDGFHFIVMQYIRGVGLDEIIPHLAEFATKSLSPAMADLATNEIDRREAQVSGVVRAILRGEFSVPVTPLESSIDASPPAVVGGEVAESGSIGFDMGPPLESTQHATHAMTKSFVKHDDGDANPEVEGESMIPEVSSPLNEEAVHGGTVPRMTASYWQSVARIGAQVASALQYAHEHGTLHRDIKPANLLIDQQGIVWVADFGLAKAIEQDDVSRTGDVVGTLRYMAPEQLFGNAEPRSDLFSLGLTLYELLTFRPAYDEADRKKCLIQRSVAPQPPLPRRIVPGVPRDLETIVLKAIAEEPERRYATSAELAEDLERFLEDRPILARRATPVEHLWRWCRRNPAVASLSGIAVSLLIVVAIVSTAGYVHTTAAVEATEQALDTVTLQRQKTENALQTVTLQRQKAEATSDLAWDALDRIFSRFAPQSVVSPEPMTLETEEGDELAFESPVVLSDQAAALLEELLKFYDLLAAQGDNDIAFQRRIADANRRVGAIQQRLGRSPQAEVAYQRAIEIYAGISTTSDDSQVRVAVAAVHNELGTIFAKTLRRNEAIDEYTLARRLLEPLAAKTNDPAVRYELAHTYYLQSWPSMGSRHRGRGRPGDRNGRSGAGRPGSPPPKGSPPPGSPPPGSPPPGSPPPDRDRGKADRAQYPPQNDVLNKAIELLEALDQQHPDVPEYQQLLAMTYVERAEQSLGDEDASQKAIANAVSILSSLVMRFPNNPDFRFALATAYATEAAADRDRTNADRGEEITRLLSAQSILKELQREHPNVPEYGASEAKYSERLGKLYSRIEEFDQAIVHLEAGLRTQEALARRHPTVNIYGMRLSFMQKNYADELRRQYDLTQDSVLLEHARDQLAASIPRSLEFMRSPDADPRMKTFVAFSIVGNFRAIGEMCEELGDDAGAAAAKTAIEELRAEFSVPNFDARGRPRGAGPRGAGPRGAGPRSAEPSGAQPRGRD